MRLLPPPPLFLSSFLLRGAFASVLFLMAGLVSGNAAAQTQTPTEHTCFNTGSHQYAGQRVNPFETGLIIPYTQNPEQACARQGTPYYTSVSNNRVDCGLCAAPPGHPTGTSCDVNKLFTFTAPGIGTENFCISTGDAQTIRGVCESFGGTFDDSGSLPSCECTEGQVFRDGICQSNACGDGDGGNGVGGGTLEFITDVDNPSFGNNAYRCNCADGHQASAFTITGGNGRMGHACVPCALPGQLFPNGFPNASCVCRPPFELVNGTCGCPAGANGETLFPHYGANGVSDLLYFQNLRQHPDADSCRSAAECRHIQTHGTCDCPSGLTEFHDGTPDSPTNYRCEAARTDCRPDQEISHNNTCVCPAGEAEFLVTGNLICQRVPTDCVNAFVDPPSLGCACPSGLELDDATLRICSCSDSSHTEFNNDTPENERDDFCAPALTCTGGAPNNMNDGCVCDDSSRPRLFDNALSGDPSDDFCAEAVSCTGGSINEMNECICGSGEVIVGGACLPNEDAASCEDYEKFVNADSGTGGACLPQVAGDCAAIANQMFVPEIENGVEIGGVCECDALYVRDANDNTCRFPSGNAECAGVNPSEPIHDENEADNCRAAESIDDCETGQIFNAVCEAPDTGQECEDAKDTSYAGIDLSGACVETCASPNGFDAAKVCQLVSNCPNDSDYLEMGECAASTNGDQCRRAKNPIMDAVYNNGICASSCDTGETADAASQHSCEATELTDCMDGEFLNDDNVCQSPRNGNECRRSDRRNTTGNEAQFFDPDADNGAGSCVGSCGTGRTEDSNFTCVPLALGNCDTGQFLENGVCQDPSDGNDCRMPRKDIENNEGHVFESERSAGLPACGDGCNTGRTADMDSMHSCEATVLADCDAGQYLDAANECQTPLDGNGCRLPRKDVTDNAGQVFESERGTGSVACGEGCNAGRTADAASQHSCEPTALTDCDTGQFLANSVCQDPSDGNDCRLSRNGVTDNGNHVFESERSAGLPACGDGCNAGRTADAASEHSCEATVLADCMQGQYIEGNVCSDPENGEDCRRERKDIAENAEPFYETDRCTASCNGNRMPDAEFTCQDPPSIECTGAHQAPDADGMCDCISGYADSDTSTPELTCTQTPTCDGANQDLDTTRNRCDCERDYVDLDDATPLECVRVCVDPEERQPDGSCLAPTISLSNCTDAQKLLAGACITLTASDCLPAEKFDDDRCVLLAPGDWTGSPPPYGAYEHGDCTNANWPWSIVQTADGLSELCHAPVNLLATEVPSSQTLNDAGEQLDFCVLRGAASGDSVRCDDPTVFGNLGIPDAPEGLVTQTTATITITLSDGSIREATTLTAAVARYLQVVHVSGSVAAIFPPDTATAEIATATALVGTISLEMPDPGTMSVTPPPATNTMTPPATNTVTPPAADGGGGGGGGGGGAAAALIAVPVVLIGGYWLLGGFDYIDPAYGLDYSGENGNLSYAAQGGFDLNHGNLNSYARAIQENGDAVEYQSGISWTQGFLALAYDAAESKSEFNYDFAASMKAEFGPFTIAPAAATEFSYQRTGEEWSSDASAGLAADWTSHRWIVKAQSAFAGAGARYRLDIRREL